MNTSLKHLSEPQIKKLARIIDVVVRAVQPEKIILYGVYGAAGSGGLPVEALPPVLGAYDLLVVTRQGDRRSDYELQDIIENRCRDEAPVTALVHDIGYVNRRLGEGQFFFSMVIQEGVLLYDSHRTVLAPVLTPDWDRVKWLAERDFKRWAQQARAFYRSGAFNYENAEWRIAVFLLHQATEQMYQAILLAFTGYKPTTHNLDKLRRYTNRFSLELAMVFPRDTAAEDELFRLLLSGYVDARYKEDFDITEKEVRVLLEKIGRLVDIGERVCLNHFVSLEKEPPATSRR
jgi:HEPN domain-containing protein